jgi:hypothetical protein
MKKIIRLTENDLTRLVKRVIKEGEKFHKNPHLFPGDAIKLISMEGEEHNVPSGTEGVVISISDDPFDVGNKLISVRWDNGSKLRLNASIDKWELIGE